MKLTDRRKVAAREHAELEMRGRVREAILSRGESIVVFAEGSGMAFSTVRDYHQGE